MAVDLCNTPGAIATQPKRIASLLASATEILYALGLGDRVVAISHECNWPPECVDKPRVTRTTIDAAADSASIDAEVRARLAHGDPLYEVDDRLLSDLQPDLIVTQAQCDVCSVKYDDVLKLVTPVGPLAGVPVVALNPYTLADVLADIERVGRAVGRSAVAARVVAELQARIDRVRQRTAELTVEQRPSVGCIEWIEPLMIAANWIPEMIELAGARQQLSIGGQHSTYTAWEALLAADPDVIVVAPCGFNLDRTLQEVRALQLRSEWSRLRAVQTGRVFACDGDALFNRSGPRLVDTLELLARLVHPERWGHRRDDPGESGVWQRLASAPLARRG